jgi:hypothetical protein
MHGPNTYRSDEIPSGDVRAGDLPNNVGHFGDGALEVFDAFHDGIDVLLCVEIWHLGDVHVQGSVDRKDAARGHSATEVLADGHGSLEILAYFHREVSLHSLLAVAGGDGSTRACHCNDRSIPSLPLMTSQNIGPIFGADMAKIPDLSFRYWALSCSIGSVQAP